jgi:hypothetical protein
MFLAQLARRIVVLAVLIATCVLLTGCPGLGLRALTVGRATGGAAAVGRVGTAGALTESAALRAPAIALSRGRSISTADPRTFPSLAASGPRSGLGSVRVNGTWARYYNARGREAGYSEIVGDQVHHFADASRQRLVGHSRYSADGTKVEHFAQLPSGRRRYLGYDERGKTDWEINHYNAAGELIGTTHLSEATEIGGAESLATLGLAAVAAEDDVTDAEDAAVEFGEEDPRSGARPYRPSYRPPQEYFVEPQPRPLPPPHYVFRRPPPPPVVVHREFCEPFSERVIIVEEPLPSMVGGHWICEPVLPPFCEPW